MANLTTKEEPRSAIMKNEANVAEDATLLVMNLIKFQPACLNVGHFYLS
jgi:hypothetical protein